MVLAEVGLSFVLGLVTPLVAVCVLPLYPGFLAFISNQLSGRPDNKRTLALIGVVVTAGVLSFMLLIGLIFTFLLKQAFTDVVRIVSPIAFGILLVVSIMLIINFDFSRIIPKAKIPMRKNPLVSAYSFGFFFGAIVIPCNPAPLIALFTKELVAATGVVTGILNFLAFGVGIGFPLLVFSFVSAAKSSAVINILTKYSRNINLFAGIFMFLVSLYYLIVVFGVFGDAIAASLIGTTLSYMFSWVGTFVPNIG